MNSLKYCIRTIHNKNDTARGYINLAVMRAFSRILPREFQTSPVGVLFFKADRRSRRSKLGDGVPLQFSQQSRQAFQGLRRKQCRPELGEVYLPLFELQEMRHWQSQRQIQHAQQKFLSSRGLKIESIAIHVRILTEHGSKTEGRHIDGKSLIIRQYARATVQTGRLRPN